MNREEAVVSLGLDTNPLDRKMNSFKGNFASKLKGIASGWSAAFLGSFSLAGAMAAFDKLASRVDSIKRISETSGLDTGMVQDLQNLASAAGISGTAVEKLLNEFTKNLKPGSNPADELARIANEMAGIKDPGDRARFAMENLGKSGIKLIPILSKGADEVRRLADEFGRISESQIEVIDNAGDKLDALGNRALVFGANVVEGADLWLRALVRIKGTLGDMWKPGWKNFNAHLSDLAGEDSEKAREQRRTKDEMEKQGRIAAAKELARQEVEAGMKAIDLLAKHDYERRFRSAEDSEKEQMLEEDYIKLVKLFNDSQRNDLSKRAKLMDSIRDVEDKILDLRIKQSKVSADEAKARRERIGDILKDLKGNEDGLAIANEIVNPKPNTARNAGFQQGVKNNQADYFDRIANSLPDSNPMKQSLRDRANSLRPTRDQVLPKNDPANLLLEEIRKLTKPVEAGSGLPVSFPVK